MNRLEDLCKSSIGARRQLAVGATSAEMNRPKECSLKESFNSTPRIREHFQLTAAPDEPPDSAGGTTRAPPAIEPPPTHEASEPSEEEDDEDEDMKAPLSLMMKLLTAVMDREFQLAGRLCQMILVYEPDNAEAAEFLRLIRRKLLQEQEEEQSTEEDEDEEDYDDDDDDDDQDEGDSDSKSDEESSQSSSSSSSPSDDEDDDDEDEEEEEEKPVNRHKPCPPPHSSP